MTWFDLVKTMVPREQLPRIDDFKPSSTIGRAGAYRPEGSTADVPSDYRGRKRYKGFSSTNPKGFTRHDIPFFLTDDEIREYNDAAKVRRNLTFDDISPENYVGRSPHGKYVPNPDWQTNKIKREEAVETMTRLKGLARARWQHYYVEENE